MDLYCSNGGSQTVELWNCSVVMLVDRLELFCSHGGGQTRTVDLFYSHDVWTDCRTVELFCSHGGGQTVELWNCSVVMVVDRL